MIDVENFIRNKSTEIGDVFINISKNGVIRQPTNKLPFSYKLDVNKFDTRFSDTIDITENINFSKMFTELKMHEKHPALYFFSINEKIDYSEILTLIEDVKLKLNKVIPVRNKQKKNLGILYVGKVKEFAWGRLIQHMGYHRNKKSHGLQLGNWAQRTSLDLNLNFTVLFFEKEASNYLQILEKELASQLKPILGKH